MNEETVLTSIQFDTRQLLKKNSSKKNDEKVFDRMLKKRLMFNELQETKMGK